jgi:hypothetical protein
MPSVSWPENDSDLTHERSIAAAGWPSSTRTRSPRRAAFYGQAREHLAWLQNGYNGAGGPGPDPDPLLLDGQPTVAARGGSVLQCKT